MTETKTEALKKQHLPFFRANLRLWSDKEPLARLVRASGHNWSEIDVKDEKVQAKGRVSAHIASRHYASSEDTIYDNIEKIIPFISRWLDDLERGAPPISALAKEGKIEAVIWVAVFGYDEIATPNLSDELDQRAKKAGVQILIENYTIADMDPEHEVPTKTFFGAGH
jgi:hypothetical protein